MSKEILMVAEAVSNEKGVDQGIIFEAIEQALAMATKKRYEEGANIRVVIDRETGDYESFRFWDVVADDVLAELGTQFTTEEAAEKDPTLKVGDTFEETVENIAFGRIAAQTAKQVIVQRVKDAERELIISRFRHRVGELLSGTVKKVTRDHIVVDFGDNAEGMLPREELVGREIFRINDRTRVILTAIREDTRGPQLLVSRAAPEMLIQLFQIEVPEIAEGIIEIKGAARDPGQRAKIAVKSKDARIDPVGACVGMRGARVQAVSNDLDDERVDIVLWDDNPAQLVINAMAFGGAMARTGLLERLLEASLSRVKTAGGLISATVGTCIGTNILAADQYLAVVIPGQMFNKSYEERNLSTINLARTIEDSGTLTSALVPWNTCGAYMSATLGVSTFLYAPFAFFNILCPIIAIIYGYSQIALTELEQS